MVRLVMCVALMLTAGGGAAAAQTGRELMDALQSQSRGAANRDGAPKRTKPSPALQIESSKKLKIITPRKKQAVTGRSPRERSAK